MAKKKSKSKAKDVGKVALFAILLFTVATIVMAFLDNVKYPAETILGDFTQKLSGFEIMFGTKEEVFGKEIEILSFSFMAFLAYLLPIAGLALAFVFNKSKLLSVIPLACFVVSAILLFLMPEFVIVAGENVKDYVGGKLAFGAIIAAICNLLSAIAVAAKILLS